jgi:hypothetical protein
MTVFDEIEKLVNDEVERRIMMRMNKYAENLSLIHGIPLRLLLRDIPSDDECEIICQGLLKSGKRCTRRAKTEGFCLSHIHQKKSVEPIQIVSEVVHNHSFPPIFKHDCPACQKTINDTAMRPDFLSTF